MTGGIALMMLLSACADDATVAVSSRQAAVPDTSSTSGPDAVVMYEVALEESWEDYGTCANPEPLTGIDPIDWETPGGVVAVVARDCSGLTRPVLGFTGPDGDLHQIHIDDLAGTTRYGGISAYRVGNGEIEVDWWASTTTAGPERTGSATITWVDDAPQVGDGSLPPLVIVDEVIYGWAGFVTPRGDIGCVLLSGSVDCSVVEPTFDPPVEDGAYCAERDLDRYAISMSDLSAPTWSCEGLYFHTYAETNDGGRWARSEREWREARGRVFAELGYGRTFVLQGVSCTSADVEGRDQLRCEQSTTGDWFEVSVGHAEHS